MSKEFKSPFRPLCSLLFLCALAASAAADDGVVPIPVAAIPVVTVDVQALESTAIQSQPISAQAVAVSDLMERWLKLYGLLDVSGIYAGNHFVAEAAAIRKRAAIEGASDAVLAQCSALAARLHAAREQKEAKEAKGGR